MGVAIGRFYKNMRCCVCVLWEQLFIYQFIKYSQLSQSEHPVRQTPIQDGHQWLMAGSDKISLVCLPTARAAPEDFHLKQSSSWYQSTTNDSHFSYTGFLYDESFEAVAIIAPTGNTTLAPTTSA